MDPDLILVVCQKSKVQDWVDHFRTYYSDWRVYDATSKKKHERRSYEYGFWVNYRNGGVYPSVVVINYDLLWRRPEFLKLHEFTFLSHDTEAKFSGRLQASKQDGL